MFSLSNFINQIHTKIIYILSDYPLFVGKIISGIFFGFFLGCIIYFLSRKNIFYTFLFSTISLFLLHYLKIISIHKHMIKDIIGFSIDNGSLFTEELKLFSEYYILEMVICCFISFLTLISLKKYVHE